jgi:hypothetical protein
MISPQDNGFRDSMSGKSDEALTEIITTKRKDYQPGAITDAENILRERGFEIEFKDVEPTGPGAFPQSEKNSKSGLLVTWLIIFAIAGIAARELEYPQIFIGVLALRIMVYIFSLKKN